MLKFIAGIIIGCALTVYIWYEYSKPDQFEKFEESQIHSITVTVGYDPNIQFIAESKSEYSCESEFSRPTKEKEIMSYRNLEEYKKAREKVFELINSRYGQKE